MVSIWLLVPVIVEIEIILGKTADKSLGLTALDQIIVPFSARLVPWRHSILSKALGVSWVKHFENKDSGGSLFGFEGDFHDTGQAKWFKYAENPEVNFSRVYPPHVQ